MTWYEKARRFTFPKNSTTSGTDPANGGPNKADALLEKPPLRANTAPRGQPSLEQEAVSNYNLDWRELRPFLMKKYPDLKFEENQYGCQDHFVFDVPENHRLTDEDRKKIDEIRAEHRAKENPELRARRREHSPDPPPRDRKKPV